MKGLIIKEPWIQLILQGKKTWEIRSSHTHIRGKVALIQSGTGKVFGTVDVVDSKYVTFDEYKKSKGYHCIPDTDKQPSPYKKIHAWVLQNPVLFSEPIPYAHPKGAVIWVNLSEEFDNQGR